MFIRVVIIIVIKVVIIMVIILVIKVIIIMVIMFVIILVKASLTCSCLIAQNHQALDLGSLHHHLSDDGAAVQTCYTWGLCPD